MVKKLQYDTQYCRKGERTASELASWLEIKVSYITSLCSGRIPPCNSRTMGSNQTLATVQQPREVFHPLLGHMLI